MLACMTRTIVHLTLLLCSPGDDTVTAYACFRDRLEADEEKLRQRLFAQTVHHVCALRCCLSSYLHLKVSVVFVTS